MEKSKLNEKNSYVSEKYPLESEQPMTTNPTNKEKKCTKKKKNYYYNFNISYFDYNNNNNTYFNET